MFNWKAIATIAFPSSISLTDRFAALEKLGYGGPDFSYSYLFWYPLGSTFFIVTVIPLFTLALEYSETWIQNKKNLIRKQLIKVVPIGEVEPLHDQISKLQQEARRSEKDFEERGKQIKERETEVAELKKDNAITIGERNELRATISEKEQTIKSLTTEKEVFANDRAAFQDEFDSQKNQLAKNLQQILEEKKLSANLLQEADKMKRNYEEAIANRDNKISLMQKDISSFQSKIDQQDSELKQLKKNNKPLTAIEQLERLIGESGFQKQEFNVPDSPGYGKFKEKMLTPIANGLTEGLDTASLVINILIGKLRTGKISKEELFVLRNKLIAGQPDNLKAAMIIKKLSDAQKLLFPDKK